MKDKRKSQVFRDKDYKVISEAISVVFGFMAVTIFLTGCMLIAITHRISIINSVAAINLSLFAVLRVGCIICDRLADKAPRVFK